MPSARPLSTPPTSGVAVTRETADRNPVQATCNGCNVAGAALGNAFVAKLNAVGSALVYSTYLGGGGDQGNGITVDTSGNSYVVGFTSSTDFPTKNPLQANLAG